MPARILDGRALAEEKKDATARAIRAHLPRAGRPPRLDVLLVGDDPASEVYVRNKQRAGAAMGIQGHVHRLGAAVTQAEVAAKIHALQDDPHLDGLILQLPLPGALDPQPLLASIDPARDVDGFHPENTGRLLSGLPGGFAPATPLGILWLLEKAGVVLRGAEVTIVSHSNLIGKPLSALLLNRDATVTVVHKYTRDLPRHTAKAEVLVTAAGVPGLIGEKHVAAGAVVIDAATVLGTEGTLRGDCDFDAVLKKASALTPVPGGVGPVTVAALLENTRIAWERRTGR